jgi:hypothetical protein
MNIFSLPIIEISVAIVISWGLFSIFCSMIHEALVQIKSERGRFFKAQLVRQFFDKPNQINWASLLYTHSSVDLLSRAYNKPASDISPKIFAEALIDTVANSLIVQSKLANNPQPLPGTIKYTNKLLNEFSFATKILLPSDIISFLKNSLTKAEIRAGATGNVVDEARVYQYLTEEIMQWYEQLSERTSIWYKKTTQKRLFMLGLGVALLSNVDSIQLFKYYSNNPEASASVIKFYETNKEALNRLAVNYDTLAKNPANRNYADSAKIAEAQKKVASDLKAYTQSIDSLINATDIPVGWADDPLTKPDSISFAGILLKILGLAISAFAASMGAPFWFDILNKANPLKK